MDSGDQFLETRVVDGINVKIYGCYDDSTPMNGYDYYDLYVDSECINLGEPLYDMPTDEVIRRFL